VHSWSPRSGLAFTQTLFWFDGRGYYDEERKGEPLSGYRLDTLYTTDGSRLPPNYTCRTGTATRSWWAASTAASSPTWYDAARW
jgi:hypothetical protein